MIVTVTLGSEPAVALADPDDFTRFHVAAHGPRDGSRLDAALAEAGAGQPDGDDVQVSVAWLRAQAAGSAGPDWEHGFTAMLDYAERKGWTDATRASVRAHVEWDQ